MTNKEASEWFKKRAQKAPMPGAREAFKLAAEALANADVPGKNVGDTISRQAAIDDIRTMNPKDAQLDIKWVEMWLKQLPPAQPELHYDEWCTSCKEYDQEKHCCPRFNRVIKSTVEELKSAQPVPCEDAVSREKINKFCHEVIKRDPDGDNDIVKAFEAFRAYVNSLPPVTPKQRTGKWIDGIIPNDRGGLPVIVCDQCNTFFPLQFGDGHNFCPNCGAKMERCEE